ncbi:uncharacterized protein LOC111715516 isoform X2 [Eurytemora carolleeae]|uniref:uncharacterized protein LOC111715516 isoform X2 n=1 Tax=Eurytemora carolleeae TaxID=1294199 RepID=UPI000C75F500|nr:uncharacterized protein LOC111715516 isoform X2 [Eurytemora carolleeae]|eukprot:XP_023346619.1 uncharacterized protein LOC111715516 isoform X2 [Eurytemora affinis]
MLKGKTVVLVLCIWVHQISGILVKIIDGDINDISQCHQEGLKECWKVQLDLELLEGLQVDDIVQLSSTGPILLKLREKPFVGFSTTTYQFIGQDGQDSSITIGKRQTGLSVYGTIRGMDRVYSIESCGSGCNVMYWREGAYFNQFDD